MIWWILIIYWGFIHAGLIVVLKRHYSPLYFIFLILFRTTNQDRKWSFLEKGRARRLVEAHFIIKLQNYRVYKFNIIGGLEPGGNSSNVSSRQLFFCRPVLSVHSHSITFIQDTDHYAGYHSYKAILLLKSKWSFSSE